MRHPTAIPDIDAPRVARTGALRCAFSLIELLVVLAVIAILVAIFAPAIGNVRQSAEGTKCLSNVRQIGMLHLAYAADNENALLVAQFAQISPWNWVNQLWQAGYIDLDAIRENPEREDIFLCPSRPIPFPDKQWMVQDNMHYGANAYPGFQNTSVPRNDIHKHKISDLENPAQTFLVGEINSNFAIWASMQRAAYPHNEHISMFFADGSARRLKGPLPPLPEPAPKQSGKDTFPFY